MTLCKNEVDTIRLELEESDITLPSLKEDLLDHLCSDIEIRILHGETFEMALRHSLLEIAPDGLYEIQKETTFLLYSSKLIPMKKLTFLIGLVSSMMMAVGALLNILHLPGSSSFAEGGVGTFGFMAFVMLFLPMLAISKFRSGSSIPQHEKIRIISGLLSGYVSVGGVLFKILHMPGANLQLLCGFLIFIFLFLPSLFFGLYKKSVA